MFPAGRDRVARLIAQGGKGARPQEPQFALEHERILERRDIDAVLIAATQHWHGRPFIQAAQAAGLLARPRRSGYELPSV